METEALFFLLPFSSRLTPKPKQILFHSGTFCVFRKKHQPRKRYLFAATRIEMIETMSVYSFPLYLHNRPQLATDI